MLRGRVTPSIDVAIAAMATALGSDESARSTWWGSSERSISMLLKTRTSNVGSSSSARCVVECVYVTTAPVSHTLAPSEDEASRVAEHVEKRGKASFSGLEWKCVDMYAR